MKPDSVSAQAFSLLTVAIMIGSSYLIYVQDVEEMDYDMRVPVWARNQQQFHTEQAYSFVLEQGPYELLETENEFDSVHVMIPYDLPIGEGGASVTCSIGMDCAQISLAYWRPKVPTGRKVPVIAEF